MSHEEDDDAFLYGSDDDQDITVKKQKLDNGGEAATKTADSSRPEEGKNEGTDEEEGDESDEEGSDEDEDSDSDIEFIVSTEEPKAETEEKSTEAASTATTTAAAAPAVSDEIGEVTQVDGAEENTGPQVTTEATITRVPGVDINKVGEYDGKPITTINLQDLKEKPWRHPGADVSEYFNYGFDEFTWMAYCAKQDNLRANFNPQKMMMSMMNMTMMGAMAPPTGIPGPGVAPIPPPLSQDMPMLPTSPQFNNNSDAGSANSTPQPPSTSASNSFTANLPKAPSGPSGYGGYRDREQRRGGRGGRGRR